MKKLILAAAILASFGVANAADLKTASATASWDATVTKDTKTQLVVTPMGSINLKYAAGLKAFNTQDGLFDVAVRAVPTATDFKLTAQLGNNTLNNVVATEKTKLDIGVRWKGVDLTKTAPTVLVDTKAGPKTAFQKITSALATETADQDSFNFYVSAAKNDTTTVAFDALPDGIWNGQVQVNFDAVWSN